LQINKLTWQLIFALTVRLASRLTESKRMVAWKYVSTAAFNRHESLCSTRMGSLDLIGKEQKNSEVFYMDSAAGRDGIPGWRIQFAAVVSALEELPTSPGETKLESACANPSR
jgi:hypothetical protein